MSAQREAFEIVAAGLRTVGGSACVAAAMMARARRFSPRTPVFPSMGGRLLRVGTVDGVPVDLVGLHRLVSIAVPALWEAARGAPAESSAGGLPVWLALPERAAGYEDPRLDGDVLDILARTSGVRIDLARSGVVRCGRAGGAEAVERALALWNRPGPPPSAVIVGGIDSYWSHQRLPAVLQRRAGGRHPTLLSEGAAFVLVTRSGAPREASGELRVVLIGAASQAPAAALDDDVNVVRPRVELLRRALRGRPAAWTLPDVDDDPQRVIAWWRVARAARILGAAEDRLGERMGDVGAAFGPASMAIAWAWWRAGVGPAASAVIALASEDGHVGAVGLEAVAG